MDKQDLLNQLDDAERRIAKYEPVSRILREVYGPITWTEGQPAIDELVSCILSQNTNDRNRDRGFQALRERFPTWQAVAEAPPEQLIDAIRPAGLANQKGPRIQRALRQIYEERGEYDIDFLKDMPVDEARDWLVNMDGIGPKTAAIVLCFSFNRPAFPVDTHVYRVTRRIGFLPEKTTYEKAHRLMEAIVPPEDHFGFHIQLIWHGRETCNARTPHCERCPLTAYCDYYANLVQPSEQSSDGKQ